MTLSASLQIGRSALTASQLALQIAGNNLANAATPGYTRQVARLAPLGGAPNGAGAPVTGGVRVQQIRRELDAALESRLADAISREQAALVDRQMLGQVESILNELSGSDLSTELSRFFNAFSELANNPTANAARGVAVEQGASLSAFVRSLRADLRTTRDQIDQRIASGARRADELLAEIAGLNREIVTSESGQGGAHALRDRRDLLIGELSQLLDVTVVASDNGSVDVYAGSTPLVLAGTSRGLKYEEESVGGAIVVSVRVRATDQPLALTGSSGQLGALMSQRTESLDRTLEELDVVAANLIYEVNRRHSVGRPATPITDTTGFLRTPAGDQALAMNDPLNGTFSALRVQPRNGAFTVIVTDAQGNKSSTRIEVDLDGVNNLGAPGFGDDTSVASLVASLNGIANLNAQVTSTGEVRVFTDAGYDVSFDDDTSGVLAVLGINAYFTGRDALDIAVRADLRADPLRLAAGADPSTGRASNSVALAVAGLRTEGVEGLGNASVTDAWRRTVERVGIASASAGTREEATRLIRENLDAQRAGVSGVSVDEESLNILTYQRQYQGAAKLIAVVDEMLQTLLSLV